MQPIYSNSTLTLDLLSPPLKLKKVSNKEYNSHLKIFKEGESDPQKFSYAEIAEYTFRELYKSKLELEESKFKAEAQYGLLIMDMVIKPDEKISKADKYFKNYGNAPLNVIGKVVNEKMVFYYQIPRLLTTTKEFSLDQLKIPPQEMKTREKVRQLTKDRAAST
jgi:hypothetical protein